MMSLFFLGISLNLSSVFRCSSFYEVGAEVCDLVCPQVPCLCSGASCLMCSCCPGSRNSTVTRIIYAFILLLGTIVACIMLSPGVDQQLKRVRVDHGNTHRVNVHIERTFCSQLCSISFIQMNGKQSDVMNALIH